MKIKLFLLLCCTAIGHICLAQDTLKLSLNEAEKLFLSNNYELILAKYQIEQAKADVITAKLFDNPEITHENLFYNHETKRFLETSYATGQFNTQISQLIKLAGKRNKNIQLANTAVKLEEYQYFDLIRTLRYQLRSSFYKLFYLQQSAKTYQKQLDALTQLLNASAQQLKLGNIANKDLLRIKSLAYNLKAEQNAIKGEIDELENTIKLLTGLKPSVNLMAQAPNIAPTAINDLTYIHILDSAKTNRIDLKAAKSGITYAEQNLKLQKANAIPDVQLSLSYDLKGSYPEKYTGIGISMPIPLFNRNQGEIKKAKIAIEAQNVNYQQIENTLSNEVFKAYKNAVRVEDLFQQLDPNFQRDFQQLLDEVTKNFTKRNISLLEFLDFYDSYKENTLQFNQLQFERLNAKEELNFVTGSTLFK
ncbi:TolC family protein [Pedobacter sp. ASV28]|uniref:TolC family protein n=1 Tax=Pedobacter sp. ASV28 TaxID=2795123 RepID=UPI0018EE14C5|nr:TolC family protein [Pedobacter sp. ASV28]